MSLDGIISSTHKEIVGSRTKNRLTVQISYAIQLIMDFYSTDFLVMMDYIEDISIITDPENPAAIHLYQVKTKTSDKQYRMTTVINEKWFQKLYGNAKKYGEYVSSASVVCNTDIVTSSGAEVFPNEKTALDDATVQANIRKLRKAIATDQGVAEKDIDLSKFFFVRTTLSTKGHKDEIEHQFQEFLFKQDPDLQVATVKSIFSFLYNKLDSKFNNEINDDCTDTQEIYDKKGLNSQEIKDLISCGLAIQIPAKEQLFSEFNIRSIQAKRKYSTCYSQIKMDMYSDSKGLINLKKTIFQSIASACSEEIDEFPALLDEVYSSIVANDSIPLAYRDEYYLKMLIMILSFKYCNGGDDV